MTLLTEKHLDSSYFVIPKDIKDIEFMENNKMICIIKGFNNNWIPGGRRTKYGRIKAFPRTEKKIGYIVLHHSEIKTEVIQDSSVDYAGFRNNMDKSLNVYGAFYLRSQVFDKENREKPDPQTTPAGFGLL